MIPFHWILSVPQVSYNPQCVPQAEFAALVVHGQWWCLHCALTGDNKWDLMLIVLEEDEMLPSSKWSHT